MAKYFCNFFSKKMQENRQNILKRYRISNYKMLKIINNKEKHPKDEVSSYITVVTINISMCNIR